MYFNARLKSRTQGNDGFYYGVVRGAGDGRVGCLMMGDGHVLSCTTLFALFRSR